MTSSFVQRVQPVFITKAFKPKDASWQPWVHNTMVQYRFVDGNVRIRFKSKDERPGWVRPFNGCIDETIRRHLRNLANGETG